MQHCFVAGFTAINAMICISCACSDLLRIFQGLEWRRLQTGRSERMFLDQSAIGEPRSAFKSNGIRDVTDVASLV
jgi:hypothetical protein